ncbi:MAG: PQQ-like beta-propeller repeat protein [Verrucomicrobiae bacterium]|nr:PQQ-like beta-propeller repeat protein [Verrucomicrobiae bacterium]
MRYPRIPLSCLLLACCVVGHADAGDWPHQRGPQQNGSVAPGSKIPASLPDDPRILWRVPVTDGFAAPIISKDQVIYGDLQKGKEVFHAIRLSDGKEQWQDILDDPHKDGFGTGPRCAPVSDGEIVLVQSCKGELHCLGASTGKLLWKTNYQTDFGAPYTGEKGTTEGGARHGYNASPCIDGDHVIALAGGVGAGVVCFKKKTGTVVWQSLNDTAAYSPPVVATVAGVEQVICFTVKGAVGVDRKDGRELWRVPMSTDYGRHIVAPVIHGDIVIVGSHQVGLIATRIGNNDGVISAGEAWKHDKELGPNVTSPICIGDHIYLLAKKGSCVPGREDR